eukprot:jgi/Botrbrau1/2094/Bobra.0093s0002.1
MLLMFEIVVRHACAWHAPNTQSWCSGTEARGERRGRAQGPALLEEEIEEAAMKCLWLSHYWGLAARYGIYPHVANKEAQYWKAVAPSPSTLAEAAHRFSTDEAEKGVLISRRMKTISGGAESSGVITSARSSTTPDDEALMLRKPSSQDKCPQRDRAVSARLRKGRHLTPEREDVHRQPDLSELGQASAADLIEIERAVAAAEAVHLMTAIDVARQDSMDSTAVLGRHESLDLGEEGREEVKFRIAWLAYVWSRAASTGVVLSCLESALADGDPLLDQSCSRAPLRTRMELLLGPGLHSPYHDLANTRKSFCRVVKPKNPIVSSRPYFPISLSPQSSLETELHSLPQPPNINTA